MTDNQELSPKTIKQQRNAFRFSLVMAVTMSVLSIVLLFIGGLPTYWLDLTSLTMMMATASIISTILSRQGQHAIGVMILITFLYIACVSTAFQFSGFGPVMAVVVMIISFGVGSASLPRHYANIVNTISILLALGFVTLDILEPLERAPNTMPFFTWTITGILAIVFGYGILRNFNDYNFRTKLIISFITMSVITLGALAIFNQITTTNIFAENLGRELREIAQARGIRIGDLLNEEINYLNLLSYNDVLQQAARDSNQSYPADQDAILAEIQQLEQQWQANQQTLILERLSNVSAQELLAFQQIFPNNAEVFLTDQYGALIASTNVTSDYYQADEGWWQTAYNDGQGDIYISDPEFDESVGAFSVLIAAPVIDQLSNQLIGIVRATYLITALNSILDDPIGDTGKADLFVPGNYPVDYPHYVHQNSFLPVETSIYEQIIDIPEGSYAEIYYEGYDSIVSKAPVTTRGGHPAIDELGWFITIHQYSAEVFASVETQTRTALILVLVIVGIAAAIAIGLAQVLVTPISRLTNTAQEIAGGNISIQAEITTQDEVGILATAFNEMTDQLRNILAGLEERITARTQDLELAAEVGQRLSLVSETEQMLTEAVNVIRDRFDLYYTQVYLADPTGRALILRAGTGEVGQTLLRRSHRLPLDMGSLNGIAATERRTVLVEDTATSSIHRANALLPDTRSEMAVPLMVGDRVVGVLDMQSDQPGALNSENLAAFEALAGSLAIAIANAELFEEARFARTTVEEQARRLTSSGWQEFLDAIERSERIAFTYDRKNITPLPDPIPSAPDATDLVTPLQVSGVAVGKLHFERERSWTEDDYAIVNSISHQVTQQIENLRLLAQAEQYQAEAQEVLRRLTREGWEQFQDQLEGQEVGYLYSDFEVRPWREKADDIQVEKAISVPISVRDEVIGQLSIAGHAALSEDDAELVAAVNEQLSAHLENLRLSSQTEQALAETEEQAEHLAMLNKLSEQLTNAKNLDEILHTTARYMQRIIPADRASITWPTGDGKFLEVYALQGEAGAIPTGTKLPLEGTAVGAAFTERRVIRIGDLTQSDYLENAQLAKQGLRSTLSVPMLTTDQTLGTLNFGSQRYNAFDNRYRDLAIQVASLITGIIENRDLLQQTQLRAQREQTLRQIATRVRTFVDTDMILQTAARELGNSLGRSVVIQIGMPQKDQHSPNDDTVKSADASQEN